MTFIDEWRSNLGDSYNEFAQLATSTKEEIHFTYGILSTAILWPIRQSVQNYDGDAIDAIRDIVQGQAKYILKAIQSWEDNPPLEAARSLAAKAQDSSELGIALFTIIEYFHAMQPFAEALGKILIRREQKQSDLYQFSGQIKAALVSAGGVTNIQSLVINLGLTENKQLPKDEPPAPGDPPFKGLQFFDEKDANTFFGRETLITELIQHLHIHRFLAVVGPSGSGKSSVVRAGLIPVLKGSKELWDGARPPKDSNRWLVQVITPTAQPLEALAASLTREVESVTAMDRLIKDLTESSRSLHLYTYKMLQQADRSSNNHLFLFVDQFEEVFTLCRDDQVQRAFVENLMTAAQPDGVTTVVISLRADFYAYCAKFDSLRRALERQQKFVGSMNIEELRQAIELPAKQAGWEFEDGLVNQLLREVGYEPGALPLLSHALLATWKRRRGRKMTFAGYNESGRIAEAVAKTAETIFSQEFDSKQQAIARNIFLRLTELGEGTPDTRRRVNRKELTPQPEDAEVMDRVLQVLADARLITTAAETVEVAHEVLIREWPTLRKWLNESREGLLIHRSLTESADTWDKNGRDPSYLYQGSRLAKLIIWAKDWPDDLNVLEQQFLHTSQRLAQQEAIQRDIRTIMDTVPNLDQLLLQTINTFCQHFSLYYAAIFLLETSTDHKKWAVLKSGYGEAGRLMVENNYKLSVDHHSMIGACLQTNQPSLIQDVRKEITWFNNPFLPEVQSAIALPFKKGSILGILILQNSNPATFSEEDIPWLHKIAEQLASVIHTAQLREK